MSVASQEPQRLSALTSALSAEPWCVPYQIHSAQIHVVDASTPKLWQQKGRPEGDGVATTDTGVTLGVLSADCPPIALAITDRCLVLLHGGWKGLKAGIIKNGVTAALNLANKDSAAQRRCDASDIRAVIGPHICVSCYEFGVDDLAELAEIFGPEIEGVTACNRPALNLEVLITNELKRLGVSSIISSGGCSAHDSSRYWSHRKRKDSSRIAMYGTIRDL